MHVGRNGIGFLAIQNGGSIAGLRLFHKGQLGIELVLILRGNREVEGLACRDLGVGLIGHREGDLGLRRLGSGQRLVDRALVAVERNVIGAGRVLDLVILAVDIKRARARHLQVGGQAILVGDRVSAEVLDIVVGKGRIDLLLQRLLVGGDLLGIALDGHREVVRALNVRRATAHKRNGRGQRYGAIARNARHLAGVVVPAITGRPNDIAVGALPANLELALGACAVRKREVGRNGLGRIARSVTDGNLLGGIVEHLLHTSLVPSNLHRLTGLVILGLAIARQLKHDVGATQTVDVVTGVVVGVDVEERHIAVGLTLGVGDTDRCLVILFIKGNAALGDLDVNIGKSQIGKLRLQRVVNVAALCAVVNNNLLVSIGELLGCSLERARGDNLVGGDELDRRAAARGDSLQILTRGRSRNRCRGARHIGQKRPVVRGSLRVVGRIPGNSRLAGDVDTVGGRTVGALGLRRRLNAIARDEMGRIAIDLRRSGHAQQVILPRCGNAIGRNPLNGVVEGARRNFDALANKCVRNSQAAIGRIDAVGKLDPIGIALALGIPRHSELGIVGHVLGRARPAARNLHARRDL